MYWRMVIICILVVLSRVIRQLTLKILLEILLYAFSTKGHSLTSKFALFFLELTSWWYYMRFAFFVKDYQIINLKKIESSFFVHDGH